MVTTIKILIIVLTTMMVTLETKQLLSFQKAHPLQLIGNNNKKKIGISTIRGKSGLPKTSYAETSFGGTADLERRLADLRRDRITGLLNTEGIPTVENPLDEEERQKEIQRVRDFIISRYPEADMKKLVISFSSGNKPMDIVVKGPKGGETKIIKDNGSGFQKNFLGLTYVKRALGESFEQIQI